MHSQAASAVLTSRQQKHRVADALHVSRRTGTFTSGWHSVRSRSVWRRALASWRQRPVEPGPWSGLWRWACHVYTSHCELCSSVLLSMSERQQMSRSVNPAAFALLHALAIALPCKSDSRHGRAVGAWYIIAHRVTLGTATAVLPWKCLNPTVHSVQMAAVPD